MLVKQWTLLQLLLPCCAFQSNTLTIMSHRNYYCNPTYQRIESYLSQFTHRVYRKNLVQWRRRNMNKATAPASGDRSCKDNEKKISPCGYTHFFEKNCLCRNCWAENDGILYYWPVMKLMQTGPQSMYKEVKYRYSWHYYYVSLLLLYFLPDFLCNPLASFIIYLLKHYIMSK